MDVSLILFDGEISIVNSGDDFWKMLLGVSHHLRDKSQYLI